MFKNVTTSPIAQRMIFPALELAYLPIAFFEEVRAISVLNICSACIRSVTGVFVVKNVTAAIRIMALMIAQPIIMDTSVSLNSYLSCLL